jgi:hypothetical protein
MKKPHRLAFGAREGVVKWFVGAGKGKRAPPTCFSSEGGCRGVVAQEKEAPPTHISSEGGARRVVVGGGGSGMKWGPKKVINVIIRNKEEI